MGMRSHDPGLGRGGRGLGSRDDLQEESVRVDRDAELVVAHVGTEFESRETSRYCEEESLMNEDESAELLALCEAILEDDEVSVDEIRQLGRWLAEHEGARRSWPGEVLAQPIQHVLLDDYVSKAELKRISVLLRRVQKEVPVTFHVMSRSERGVMYDVDLTGPSCNCPDWRTRSALAPGDLTRCCKHVRPGSANGAESWVRYDDSSDGSRTTKPDL